VKHHRFLVDLDIWVCEAQFFVDGKYLADGVNGYGGACDG
jgi:hypothetical protein